jgi:carboxyl-terminal processing protease
MMIDELDPLKVYFLSPEIQDYLNPSDLLCQKTLEEFHKSNFTEYLKLHSLMESAINRREKLEPQIFCLKEKIDPKNFKELTFSDTEEALLSRLCQVKTLQEQTLGKLNEDSKTFFAKIKKRRLHHENELLGRSHKEKEEIALSLAIKAIAASLDSQTHYFTPKEAQQFLMQVQQRLFGIGAQLRDDLRGLSVIKIIEGSPAFRQGQLKVGDTIIAVDDQVITGMDISEAVELIKGPEGTKVKLTLINDQDLKQELELTRGEIVIQETRLEKTVEPFGDGVIAHIHLYSFYQDEKTSSASDIALALNQIQSQHNLKGVILDLRFNAGGLLSQAVSVSGLFMKPGIVVSVKDNTGFISHLRTTEKEPLWSGPLIVILNKASASAAEIVAQTLQDYKRTFIVGDEHSYGKGTFQTFTLDSSQNTKVNPKGEYKVTRGLYYTVSGKSPQLQGVKSDIVVHGPLAFSDFGESYSKFPLQPDKIEPNFEDSMHELSLFQKLQLERVYEHARQTLNHHLDKPLAILKLNAQQRLEQNRSYQNFITEIKSQDHDSDLLEKNPPADFQLQEALDLMKDWIFINKTAAKAA